MIELGLLIFISTVTLSYTLHRCTIMICQSYMNGEVAKSFSAWMRDGFKGIPNDVKDEFEATRRELNKQKMDYEKSTTDEK